MSGCAAARPLTPVLWGATDNSSWTTAPHASQHTTLKYAQHVLDARLLWHLAVNKARGSGVEQ
eukprot:scaffold131242_cov57-Phaeocystis_antarctica.AAC.1